MKPQIVSVRDKSYFICEYTGAPCTTRYFIPRGKSGKKKEGCYASLPILLRHIFEKKGMAAMMETKAELMTFFDQPDIPMQPALDIAKVPLSSSELELYLLELDMGMAWTFVAKGDEIRDSSRKRQKL